MPIHDAYARRTPWEVAFPDEATAEDWMARIRDGAGRDGMESALRDPGRFLSLPSVAEVVHEMREPGVGGEEVQKHGVLLFHAFHFHEAERVLLFLETGAVRYLVEADVDAGRGAADPPASAGYIQLPHQLFWTTPAEEAPPEPVDGMFWAVPDGERLSLLLVGGMREDRPGFSVIPLPPVPLSDADAWLRGQVRESGSDFETTLPGGELDRLYSIEATGEALKLAARVFRYVRSHPEAVTREEATGGEPADADPEDPPPTALPYGRVHLEDQIAVAEDPPTGTGGRSVASEDQSFPGGGPDAAETEEDDEEIGKGT